MKTMPKLLLTIEAIEPEPDKDRRNRNRATAERRSGGNGAAYATNRDSIVIEQHTVYTGEPEDLPLRMVQLCYPLLVYDDAESVHSALTQWGYSSGRIPVTHSDHSTAEIYITFQWLTDRLQPIHQGSTETGINARI